MCSDGHASHGAAPTLHDVAPPFEIALEPVDSVAVTTIMDNVVDLFMPDQGPARRLGLGLRQRTPASTMEAGEVPDALLAEHGFSLLVTVVKDGTDHRLLYDAGTTPDGVVENMRRLDIDPSDLEAIVCSHGHFDHTAGLDGLVHTLGRTNLPVLIHPHFWRRRRVTIPGLDAYELPTTSRRALEAAGFDILEQRQPSFLFERSVLVTGEVARTSGYEPGFPPQQALVDGSWEADPLVLDDQALVIDVKGKGLVVMTGCGHAGIVNICRYARRLTGGRPLYAAIGGFHLQGPVFEPLISQVCDDLSAMTPSVVVPAHCTGWRARHRMSAVFGDAYVPNTVGSRFEL